MNDKELLEFCETQAKLNKYIDLPEDIFLSITEKQAEMISISFKGSTLLKMPAREIAFFEWLKVKDIKVWEDLWGNQEEEPYIVSITFLPLLMDKTIGFPICDLVYNDNYYFTDDHIVDEESKMLVDSAKQRFLDNKPLSIAQLLVLQISLFPVDIWHFAYNNNIDLVAAKKAVEELEEDKVLVHLREAEILANFVKF